MKRGIIGGLHTLERVEGKGESSDRGSSLAWAEKGSRSNY